MKTVLDYIKESSDIENVSQYSAYKLLLPHFLKMTEYEKTEDTEIIRSQSMQDEFDRLVSKKENNDLLNSVGIYSFKDFIYWMRNHRHIMKTVADREREKKRVMQNNKGIIGKTIEKITGSEPKVKHEEIVLYHCDFPTKHKTTKRYKIRYISDDQRAEKIKELKREWKAKTGENISDCYDILAYNYDKKYLNKENKKE
jgi:hypothetical protein